jgi:hypothetical protein
LRTAPGPDRLGSHCTYDHRSNIPRSPEFAIALTPPLVSLLSEILFMIRRVAVIAAALGLSLVASQSLWAQQGRQQAPKTTPVKVDGTVEAISPQGILVAQKDGKKFGMAFPPNAKVTLSGNAAPEFLKTGQYVQFTVNLDEKKKPTGEASKIQIIEQSAISSPGVFSEKGPDGKPGEPGPYFIRGTVKSFRDGTLSVAAGGPLMTVTIPASAAIPVTIADWDLANPGDQISGDGQALPAATGAAFTPVFAERIEIKSAAPITGKKKKS